MMSYHELTSSVGDLLGTLVDTIIPEDGFPAASTAGSLVFLESVFTAEHPEWLPRLERVLSRIREIAPDWSAIDDARRLEVLDRISTDIDYRWFATLVQIGYYADPSNGGNNNATSWRMLGWNPDPPAGWPSDSAEIAPDSRAVVDPQQIAAHYDVVVIGSGAGGAVAACLLSEAGRQVLLVERGDWPDTDYLGTDHIRNARAGVGFEARTDPDASDDIRILDRDGELRRLRAADPAWGANAMTVGGGTRVFGAHAWRLAPEDFAMASTYGVPEGSSLADWPVSYDDMEASYSRAEWELGVSGTSRGDSAAGFRSRDYPMPPLTRTLTGDVLLEGARSLGISTFHPPLLINSQEYNGRAACARVPQCVGFACRDGAKNGAANTLIPRALATGRCDLVLHARAQRILTDTTGHVTGVALAGENSTGIWRREISADEVIVSAGAIETARLLLASTSAREPNGLGNANDLVGRHLQGHVYAAANGLFEDAVSDLTGPGPTIATSDYRHHNAGYVGGGMLTNAFVATPVGYFGYLRSSGWIGLHGREVKEGMRSLIPRMARVIAPVHEVTGYESRVRLDPRLRDRFGMPIVRLSGATHPEDHRMHDFLVERAVDWLEASGAREIFRAPFRSARLGPSSGQHQAGTARMGTDPDNSVTDRWGRVWGHDNLRVVDGSLNVTNGGVNPVLTIFANAFRVIERMVREK